MTAFTKRNDLTVGIALAAMFGGFAAVLLSIVWGGFWAGLTLSVLWGWFVVPLFAVPALTIWQAYGLVLVARTLRGMTAGDKTKDKFGEAMAKAFLIQPFACGLVLLVGWVTRAWTWVPRRLSALTANCHEGQCNQTGQGERGVFAQGGDGSDRWNYRCNGWQ